MFANVAKKQINLEIRMMLLHLTRENDVMCFKHFFFFEGTVTNPAI